MSISTLTVIGTSILLSFTIAMVIIAISLFLSCLFKLIGELINDDIQRKNGSNNIKKVIIQRNHHPRNNPDCPYKNNDDIQIKISLKNKMPNEFNKRK